MPVGEAEAWWRGVAQGVAAGDILLWAISDDDGPLGKPLEDAPGSFVKVRS